MGPFTWICQCWPTSKNFPTTALCGLRKFGRPAGDRWMRGTVGERESEKPVLAARHYDDISFDLFYLFLIAYQPSYIYIYIYIYLCVCVCMCVCLLSEVSVICITLVSPRKGWRGQALHSFSR